MDQSPLAFLGEKSDFKRRFHALILMLSCQSEFQYHFVAIKRKKSNKYLIDLHTTSNTFQYYIVLVTEKTAHTLSRFLWVHSSFALFTKPVHRSCWSVNTLHFYTSIIYFGYYILELNGHTRIKEGGLWWRMSWRLMYM